VTTIDWWSGRIRQGRRHLLGRVTSAERLSLRQWLSEPELTLFDAMHRADQRHGLDVVAHLRAEGHGDDRDLLLAGLLHDCGKGPRVTLAHRVAWSLGKRYGDGVLRVAAHLPGFGASFVRLRDHADTSAKLAEAAGCSPRTVELIRHQEEPVDPIAGQALRLADEAS
jgi:hypothetical protein